MAFHSPSPPPTDGWNFHPYLAASTAGDKTHAAMIVGLIFVPNIFFFVFIYTKSFVVLVFPAIYIVFYCGFLFDIFHRFSCRCRRFPLISLDDLPVFEYKAQSFKDVLECAICLSEFEENEKGRFLPNCEHSFHVDCIDMWFHSHSTCPVCRTDVEPKQRVSNGNNDEISINVELVSLENSALAQDSHKGKQALIKRKPQNKSPFTSGMSSTPETAIDLPSRSESFTSRSEDNVK